MQILSLQLSLSSFLELVFGNCVLMLEVGNFLFVDAEDNFTARETIIGMYRDDQFIRSV